MYRFDIESVFIETMQKGLQQHITYKMLKQSRKQYTSILYVLAKDDSNLYD